MNNSKQKLYNITFTLGDSSGDGNCVVFHMESNYSVQDITNAYNKATKILGFDFIKTCCVEYGDHYIKNLYTPILIKFNIINKTENLEIKDFYGIPKGTYYVDDGVDEYVDIFIKIIKLVLKDFTLEYRDLHEDSLSILDSAAYGLIEYT